MSADADCADADFDAALADVYAKLAALTRPIATGLDAAFADAVRRHGVIAGHPATIAALEAHPDTREGLRGVRLFSHAWLERGKLYTGAIFAESGAR